MYMVDFHKLHILQLVCYTVDTLHLFNLRTMPELPEVETIVRELNESHLMGKKLSVLTFFGIVQLQFPP